MKIRKHKIGINIRKIKKKNENKEKMAEKIADFLEVPEELIGKNCKITLVDNRFFYLESSNQIVDYYANYIKLKTNNLTVSLDGKKMQIKEISKNELVIEGEILNVSLSK